jgi:transposase-like protein
MAKKFSEQFKDQAVDLAVSYPSRSIAELAAELGIGHSTLDKWVRQRGNNKRQPLSAEVQKIRQLERELRHLREVNDILKKAHKYFVGQSR